VRNRDEHTPLTASPSEDLLLRFQAGEEACLDRLWARYYPRLKRWAHGRLPAASRGDVSTDDLIQDAFVRSLASLRTLRPQGPNSLFAYFRTIVLNKIRDYGRKATRQPRPEELLTDQHLDAGASPLEQVLGLELMQQYERALSTLAENDQQLILAFVELRCSDRELADLFEKPSVDAARMARGRALARLADAMAGVVRSDPAGRSIL
jgi:RNA polymerase sigma-70 factor (ECF subfamily)